VKFALFSGSAPELNPAQLVGLLKEQGWDGVEWRVTDQEESSTPGFWAGNLATFPLTGLERLIDEIDSTTRGAGLDHAGIAGYVAIDDHENADRLLSATAALGAKRVRLQVPKATPGSDYESLFAQTRTHAQAAVKLAARHGVQVLIQIHHGSIISTASAARRLLDELDPNHIGVIHDLGNLTIEGREGLQSYVPGLQVIRDYLAHVHVKNAVWKQTGTRDDGTVEWSWEWAPLRSGMGDVPLYLSSLAEVGYDGWVTVENFTNERTLTERLKDDIDYLHGAVAEMS
jgi:sugar phosphate isomerase/epimerase